MILAIDTSTNQGSVALASGGAILAELSWSVNDNHSRHLSHVVQQLLQLENLVPHDIRQVVVARGPGSFSGLRVGISAAKGIALALDIPLAGIGTLDVIGFQGCHIAPRVHAFMPAGRGEVFAARYEGGVAHFKRIGDHQLLTIPDAVAGIDPRDLIAGPAGAVVALETGNTSFMACLEPETMRIRRSGFLAELGRRYFDTNGADQTDDLEPLYLRRSAAEDKLAGSTG